MRINEEKCFSMDVNHEFNNLYIINNEQSDSDIRIL